MTDTNEQDVGVGDVAQQVEAAIAPFPTLSSRKDEGHFVIEGALILEQDGTPFDEFAIRLHIPDDFPASEPKLFETGGRIPPTIERHINEDGSACYEVFEYWLVTTQTQSVSAFLQGPVINFFLSQTIYELTDKWPFGQRAHGLDGLIEAACEAVGANEVAVAASRLKVLRYWPQKGHHHCPCGSGQRFRDCHREELSSLHDKISPMLAGRIVDRILKAIEARRISSASSKPQ